MKQLIYPGERTLFVIAFILATLVWLALIGGTLGIALIYLLLGFIVYLFVHSAFISYLKGTGVKITETQMPDLHQRVQACSAKLGIQKVPEAYLIHGNGLFNAFATRFLGRNFLALYSDIVDAMATRPDAVNFYIGHELGHIHRKHLQWGVYLAPAVWLPLLGAAYSRAREYTGDRYGLACCGVPEDAMRGLGALAAGADRWKALNLGEYKDQSQASRGFWMSFHELTADYPWLTKRMTALAALGAGSEPVQPRRNPFAYLFALFVPRVPGAGGASFLIMIALVGVMAAVAIPAYQDFTVRAQQAQVMGALSTAGPVKAAVEQYGMERQAWPNSNQDLSLPENAAEGEGLVRSMAVGQNGQITIVFAQGKLADKTVWLTPNYADGQFQWSCSSPDIGPKELPPDCQGQ